MLMRLIFLAIVMFYSGPAIAALPHGSASPAVTVSASPSPTTINLTWTSVGATTSTGGCGTSPGGPYTAGTAIVMDGGAVTSHDVIVEGLVASTTYYCRGSGGGVGLVSTATLATPSTTPLTGATFSTGTVAVNNQNNGDTYYNATNAAGDTYVVTNDSEGWVPSFGFYHMLVGKITGTSPFTGVNVNLFPNFAPLGTSPKLFGMMFYNSNLYAIYSGICGGNCAGTPNSNIATQLYGSIFKSPDNAVSWSNGQAPFSYDSGGSVPSPVVSGFAQYSMFDSASGCAQSAFVTYGADNATVLPSIRIDNADAFAYFLCTDPVIGQANTGYQFNGNAFYLARMPLADLPGLSTSRIQYYIGGPNGNGIDGSLDGAWQSAYSGAVAILSNPGHISNSQMAYLPNMKRYVILNWYWTSLGTWTSTTRITYECAHPWSCTSTPIEGPTAISPQGFYNATVFAPSALTATPNGAPATLFVAGDFVNPTGYYQLYIQTVMFSQ